MICKRGEYVLLKLRVQCFVALFCSKISCFHTGKLSQLWCNISKNKLDIMSGSLSSSYINDRISGLQNPSNLSLVEFHSALDLYEKLKSLEDESLSPAVQNSLCIISDALRMYGPMNLYGSFNGGKDAVVVLHLFR